MILISLTLQNIQTDATQFVNVGMVDLGKESNLWWGHRIVVWEKELELEYTACGCQCELLSCLSDV